MLSPEEKRERNRLACRKYKKSEKYIATYSKRYSTLKESGEQSKRSHDSYMRGRENNKSRWKHLSKYGINLEDYSHMLALQNGKCLICGEINQGGKVLCVDHDHKTGKVRGLLCTRCNANLGIYETFKELAEKYIDRFKG